VQAANRGPAQVCPWCYIGHKELFDAIRASEHLPFSFEVEYRPYQLDPSMNEHLGVEIGTYLNGRLGPERFAQIQKIVSAKASTLGLDMCVSLFPIADRNSHDTAFGTARSRTPAARTAFSSRLGKSAARKCNRRF
jgi:predicted DsbA family dithiol-disulfide isomerase